MKLPNICFFLASLLFIFSCTKDKPAPSPSPSPSPAPKADTLTAGWKKITVDTVVNFGDVFFYNNTVGYLTGDKTYKSIDGGMSWSVLLNSSFENIAVTANGNVFLVSEGLPVFKSVDAGNTFIKYNTALIRPFDVFFADNNIGYITALDGIHKTVDGGSNWTRISTTAFNGLAQIATSFFNGMDTGWICNTPNIYKTTDAGQNWVLSATLNDANLTSIFVTPNQAVYIGSSSGKIYKSVDAGVSFVLSIALQSSGFTDLHFVDNNTGYACSGNKIYKTTDAGVTWVNVVTLGSSNIIELHFTDAHHGWACGSKGTVLVYSQ